MKERSSRQRAAVYRAVREARDHPTAQDVFSAVRRELPQISLATVYRNLLRLVEEGKVRAVHAARLAVRYEGVLDDHGHFICSACGTIGDLSPSITPAALEQLCAAGFAIERTSITVHGICPRCNH